MMHVPIGPENWTFLKVVTPVYDDTEKCVSITHAHYTSGP